MDNDFQQAAENKLSAFREWSNCRHFGACRLVQYCGVECVGGIDVPLSDVEMEIKGALLEEFRIDWQEHDRRLYLVVWEPVGLEWTWLKVFAEQHLADDTQSELPTA